MNFEDGLQVADEAVFLKVGRRLNEVEIAILQGSWQGQSYDEIAIAAGYSASYLQRDVGPKLWRMLAKALGESVSKTNFRPALERQWRAQAKRRDGEEVLGDRLPISSIPSPPVPTQTATPHAAKQRSIYDRVDWGEAVDVSSFYGRATELATLTQWIVSDRCRLVALLGMGGIGKTTLSAKLANQILMASALQTGAIPEFEYVVWRSLRNAPPLETLLSDLIPFLSNQQETKAEVSRLIHCLRQHRCLLILDNLETLLQPGYAGRFLPGYEAYGELLRMIGEVNHQSCLILTSREKPAEVAAFEGIEQSVRSLRLSGSPEAAQALLWAKKLSGSKVQKQTLCDRYGNSPLALKIVANSIYELFEGDVSEFLKHDTLIFNGIRRLLDQQFDRLSAVEQSIMYWLAINREWTTIAELQEDLVPTVSRGRLLESLEYLNGRSLIEKQAGKYTQQPVVMEYVTDCLIERIAEELTTAELSLFVSCALIKTTVKDYVRESQVRLILQPIAAQFCKTFSSSAALEQQILRILLMLRRSETKVSGYGAGNLINLCTHLKINLTGYDFSGLTIWYACLQKVNLHRVNLAYAELAKSVFTQTFGSVLSVAFSPDGKLLATGDENGEVRLWQVSDGQLLLTLTGHINWVWTVAFSPDGQTLASGSEDRTVRLWNVHTGQCLRSLPEHRNWVYSVAFSPDGQTLASASETVWLWDIQTGQPLRTLQEYSRPLVSLSFSPDGQVLACGGEDQLIRLWDVSTGKVLSALQGNTHTVWSLSFSPDGQLLAGAGENQPIRLWDIETGQVLGTLQGDPHTVWSLSFSPDGQLLAGAGEDKLIRVWDVETGQVLRTLQGHGSRVWSVAFNPNGQTLASGSLDQTTRIWDVYTGQCLKTLQGHTNHIFSVAFSPNRQILASGGGDQSVRLWEVPSGKFLKALQEHKSRVWSVIFSPDGQTLASGSDDQTIKLWNVETGQCFRTLQGHINSVRSVLFSPDSQTLVSSSQDRTIKVWNVQTGQCLQTLQGHLNWIRAIALSPAGDLLASGSLDETIRLWDMRTGKCLKTLQSHTSQVFSIAFSADGQILISGSQDQTIRLWDVQTGKCLKALQGHMGPVWSVGILP